MLAFALIMAALEIIGSIMHPLYNKTAAVWSAIAAFPWLLGIGLVCLVLAVFAAIAAEW